MEPKHLAITFPIWALHDTPGAGAYHDLDRMVAETAARGFNCIRCDDGAGLIDFSCKPPNGVVPLEESFTGLTSPMRQSWCIGDGGPCDLLGRLVELMTAARRHGVYVILSSWYYLHTCWYCGDMKLNRRLHEIPAHERVQYFAEQLDHILDYLRKRGLLDNLAFAEILNEADGLCYMWGCDLKNPNPEQEQYRREHERALDYLKKRNPEVRFAYDTASSETVGALMPGNADVWNFHPYYMWKIYSLLEGNLLKAGTDVNDPAQLACAEPYLKTPRERISLDAVRATRAGRIPGKEDWYRRIWLYNNLDPRKLPELEQALIRRFEQDYGLYQERLVQALERAVEIRDQFCPGAQLVAGEACAYVGLYTLLWEEHCDKYWELMEFAARQYRKYGLLGGTLRTCSGAEDPSWILRAQDYRRINGIITE